MLHHWIKLAHKLQYAQNNNNHPALVKALLSVLSLNSIDHLQPDVSDAIITMSNESLRLLSIPTSSLEAIIEIIDALIEYILCVVPDSEQPKMIDQTWFMDKMLALNYRISGHGECYGFSQMVKQAFFANDMERFNQRLGIIYRMPLDDFENDFWNLRTKKSQLLLAGLQDKADEIDSLIIDLYAFFDGIALNQSPMSYFFGENDQPLSKKQDIRKTALVTNPVVFDKKDDQENAPNQPIVLSSFSGAYNEQELISYFELLKKKLGMESFSINLLANMHSIMLTYDAKTKRWLLTDPSNLPGKEYLDEAFLASTVMTSLLARDFKLTNLVIGSQISVRTCDEKKMQQQFASLQTSKDWAFLHNLPKMETNYFALTKASDSPFFGPSLSTESPNSLMSFFYAPEPAIMELIAPLTNGDCSEQQVKQIRDSLTMDQKIELINHGYVIDTFIVKEHEKDLLEIFSLLHANAQALIFQKCLNDKLQRKLLSQLSTDQKLILITVAAYTSILPLLMMLTDSERESIFPQLPRINQWICFISGNTPSNTLMKLLNVEDKLCLLNNCLKFETSCYTIGSSLHFLTEASHDSVSHLFMMLTDSERVSIFPQLHPYEQRVCLMNAGEQTNTLIQLLDVESKLRLIHNFSFEFQIGWFFLLLTEEERGYIFSRMDLIEQGELLVELTTNHLELSQAWFNTLDNNSKFKMLNSTGFDSLTLFLMLTTPQERIDWFPELNYYTQQYFLEQMFDDQTQQYRLIRSLSLEQKNNIIHLYRNIHGNEASQNLSNETLTDILDSLGLTKETLTSYSLRQCFRKFHPDKIKEPMQDMHSAFDDIKILQTFISTTSLMQYRDDEQKREQVGDRLAGVTSEDRLYLIKKSIESIQTESDHLHQRERRDSLLTQTLQAYEKGDLSFNNTLDILSYTAFVMIHPETCQGVNALRERYKDHMSASWHQALDELIGSSQQETKRGPVAVNQDIKKRVLALKSSDDKPDVRDDPML